MSEYKKTMFNSYEEAFIFPTTVFKLNCQDKFHDQEVELMIKFIEEEIYKGNFCKEELYSNFQTTRNIFSFPEFTKLKDIFYRITNQFLKNVEGFSKATNVYQVKSSHALGCRSSGESKLDDSWHNNTPALVSGVFFLQIPQDDKYCGTEFKDPNSSLYAKERTIKIMPELLSWVVFPSLLYHRAILSSSIQSRYVIAADAFIG